MMEYLIKIGFKSKGNDEDLKNCISEFIKNFTPMLKDHKSGYPEIEIVSITEVTY